MSTLHTGHTNVGIGAVTAHVWTTSPWTITTALLLLGTAVVIAARPARLRDGKTLDTA